MPRSSRRSAGGHARRCAKGLSARSSSTDSTAHTTGSRTPNLSPETRSEPEVGRLKEEGTAVQPSPSSFRCDADGRETGGELCAGRLEHTRLGGERRGEGAVEPREARRE